MQISLQSFLAADDRIVIDPELPRNESDAPDGVCGIYAQLGDRVVGMFASCRRLFLWVDGDTIEVDDSVTASHRAGQTVAFSVYVPPGNRMRRNTPNRSRS